MPTLLVYLMIRIMKIGIICLLLMINIFPHILKADDLILFPKDPPLIIPPQRGEDAIQEDLDEKQDYWKMKYRQLPDKPSPTEQRNVKLVEESLKDRPLDFELAFSFIIPYAKVRGNQKYKMDPGVDIHSIFRPQKSYDISKLQVYLGMRACFFSGSLIGKNIFAHFNFMYLSPILGVGKIYLAQKDVSKNVEQDKKNITKYIKPHTGWMLLVGPAIQSRYIQIQEKGSATQEIPEEYKTKSIDVNELGLWLEVLYKQIYFGAIGINLLSGIQLGKGKTFYYVGVGTSGWN